VQGAGSFPSYQTPGCLTEAWVVMSVQAVELLQVVLQPAKHPILVHCLDGACTGHWSAGHACTGHWSSSLLAVRPFEPRDH
jgi:hypothetical protein